MKLAPESFPDHVAGVEILVSKLTHFSTASNQHFFPKEMETILLFHSH